MVGLVRMVGVTDMLLYSHIGDTNQSMREGNDKGRYRSLLGPIENCEEKCFAKMPERRTDQN